MIQLNFSLQGFALTLPNFKFTLEVYYTIKKNPLDQMKRRLVKIKVLIDILINFEELCDYQFSTKPTEIFK